MPARSLTRPSARSPVRSLAHSLARALSLSLSISRTASCRSVSRLEREHSRSTWLLGSSCARGVSCARFAKFVRAALMMNVGPTRGSIWDPLARPHSPARSLARTHAHARVRATKYGDAAARRLARQAAARFATFLTRIRGAARRARDDPPCAYHGPPRRADQRAAVSHDGVSLPRWKNRTQHSLSSKLQNGGKAHAVARDAFWGPAVRRAAPPRAVTEGARAAPFARHFRIHERPAGGDRLSRATRLKTHF